nr:putative DNA-binding domain-containing protein [Marinicella sp. W31]MDC2878644.1 putative DNA-binding domain-containing protein [Marinicella sp. W31]
MRGCDTRAFAAALSARPLETAPDGVANPLGGPAIKRFGVYRNNVAVGLKAALADIFPVTRDLVGERFFAAMSGEYIDRAPPHSPVLSEYGHGFADFIASFEPASKLFFLPDVARLERAWLDAYHARDAAPLSPGMLDALPPEELMALALSPHPATHLLHFSSAAAGIFSRVRNGSGLKDFDPTQPETVLVTRPQFDVAVVSLDRGLARFFDVLVGNGTIGDAAETAMAADPDFDLGTAFSALITTGAFFRPAMARSNRHALHLFCRARLQQRFSEGRSISRPWFPGMFARLAFAATLWLYFLNSALTKVEPGLAGFFVVRSSAYYQIALPAVEAAGGDVSAVPFLPWGLIVHLGTYTEFALPLLIVFGLATRLSALGMLAFIAVQTFVDITVHQVGSETIGALFDRFPDSVILDQRLFWSLPLVMLVIYGPGRISLDHLAGRLSKRWHP